MCTLHLVENRGLTAVCDGSHKPASSFGLLRPFRKKLDVRPQFLTTMNADGLRSSALYEKKYELRTLPLTRPESSFESREL